MEFPKGFALKKTIVVISFIISLIGSSFCFAQSENKPYSIGLSGGYTVFCFTDYDVAAYGLGDEQSDFWVNDDSYVNPAPIGAVSFTYWPVDRKIPAGITLEGAFLSQSGQFKGAHASPTENETPYAFNTHADFYQVHLMLTLAFSKTAFRPFLQLGMGPVINNIEIGSNKQTAYGASAVLDFGGEYRLSSRFGFGAKARLQQMLGLSYHFRPYNDAVMFIEAGYLPISLMACTNFYF